MLSKLTGPNSRLPSPTSPLPSSTCTCIMSNPQHTTGAVAGVGLRENEVDGYPQVHLCQQLMSMAALQAGGVVLDEPDKRTYM